MAANNSPLATTWALTPIGPFERLFGVGKRSLARDRRIELAAYLMASAVQPPRSAASKNAIPAASVIAWV